MNSKLFSLKNLVWSCAIGLATFSGYYSVFGISKLFSENAWSIVGMASMLEISKLVVITFLHDHFSTLKLSFKIYLTTAASILMIITSIGVYGYLTNSYQETAKYIYEAQNKTTMLDQKKNIFSEQKSKIDTLIVQKINRINSYDKIRMSQESSFSLQVSQKGNTKNLQKSIESIDKTTQDLNVEISELNKKTLVLSDSIASIEQEKLQVTNSTFKSELGPLLYLSRITGLSMDFVVNWFILVLVIVFDPLAVSLVIAANHLKHIKQEKLNSLHINSVNEHITDAITIPEKIDEAPAQVKEIIEENELDQINLTESDQVITEDVTKIETQSEVPNIIEVHEKFTEMDNMENFVNNESISDNISKIDEEEQKDFYQESKPISYRRGISL